MRQFLSGSNVDTTATVLAALRSTAQLALADLILIGEYEDQLGTRLTGWNSPLDWPLWGIFQPAVYTRGKITSQVGLSVDSLSFEWSPPLTAFGTTALTANPYQKAQAGFYDNQRFRLWRCVMPTPGDANTYGACEFFGGRIADTKIERGKITFTVNSFLDVLNQQVPPNVIELNNTLANFAGATPVVADAETAIAQFEVEFPGGAAVSTPTRIWATCLSPTLNKAYATNRFQGGYMVFNPGSSLAGYFSVIAASGNLTVAGTPYNYFDIFGAFPWPAADEDSFYVSVKPPINLADAVAGFQYFGFPYVPQPEGAA